MILGGWETKEAPEKGAGDPEFNGQISFLMVALMSWHDVGITWLFLESKRVGLYDCTLTFFNRINEGHGDRISENHPERFTTLHFVYEHEERKVHLCR